jgi:dihydroorotate dehydrogenase electron transfer subunit
LGFATKNKVIRPSLIKNLKNNIHICTDDGSFGKKGNVVEIINKHNLNNLYYYTCGPTVMMKALFKNNPQGGQISLDARMGCGFGACMGCSIQTKNGPQRICRNGPVFYSKDLLW